MSESPVLVTRDDRGVVTLTLNRPDRGNAYDGAMIKRLNALIEQIGDDPSARVVVIRGAGKHFQAGADLRWVESTRGADWDELQQISIDTTRAFSALNCLAKPTLALVHGGCFGGGTGIASACDVVVAARDAMFAITEARWGLVVTPAMPQLIARLGAGRARRYALTCERFSGERAFQIGFADEVCDAADLDATAAPIIDALLHCPPGALADTKMAALKYANLYLDPASFADLVRPHALKRMSEEAEEGLESFLSKRPPAWYPGPSE